MYLDGDFMHFVNDGLNTFFDMFGRAMSGAWTILHDYCFMLGPFYITLLDCFCAVVVISIVAHLIWGALK